MRLIHLATAFLALICLSSALFGADDADRLAAFFDWEPVEAGAREPLPNFRAYSTGGIDVSGHGLIHGAFDIIETQ